MHISVCAGHTLELAKTAEPIEIPFEKQTRGGSKSHAVSGIQGGPKK